MIEPLTFQPHTMGVESHAVTLLQSGFGVNGQVFDILKACCPILGNDTRRSCAPSSHGLHRGNIWSAGTDSQQGRRCRNLSTTVAGLVKAQGIRTLSVCLCGEPSKW